MAFDQPLESDQIGDNALISFVTKPILGTLMWIIGDDDDGNANHQEKLLQQGLQDMMMDDDDDDGDTNHHGQQRGLPRLARSDVSVGGDRGALDPPSLLPRRSSFSHLLDEDAPIGRMNLNNHNNHSYPQQQQQQDKKKMSWSENLVEYMDDEVRKILSTSVVRYACTVWNETACSCVCWVGCMVQSYSFRPCFVAPRRGRPPWSTMLHSFCCWFAFFFGLPVCP